MTLGAGTTEMMTQPRPAQPDPEESMGFLVLNEPWQPAWRDFKDRVVVDSLALFDQVFPEGDDDNELDLEGREAVRGWFLHESRPMAVHHPDHPPQSETMDSDEGPTLRDVVDLGDWEPPPGVVGYSVAGPPDEQGNQIMRPEVFGTPDMAIAFLAQLPPEEKFPGLGIYPVEEREGDEALFLGERLPMSPEEAERAGQELGHLDPSPMGRTETNPPRSFDTSPADGEDDPDLEEGGLCEYHAEKERLLPFAMEFMLSYFSDGRPRQPSAFDRDIMGTGPMGAFLPMVMGGSPPFQHTIFREALRDLVKEGRLRFMCLDEEQVEEFSQRWGEEVSSGAWYILPDPEEIEVEVARENVEQEDLMDLRAAHKSLATLRDGLVEGLTDEHLLEKIVHPHMLSEGHSPETLPQTVDEVPGGILRDCVGFVWQHVKMQQARRQWASRVDNLTNPGPNSQN